AIIARDLREIGDAAETRALGDRLELTNAHFLCLENVYRIAFGEPHNGFLPMRTTSDCLTDAAILASMIRGPDAGDLDVEELFDRAADLGFRRFAVNAKRILTAILVRRRGLLGDDRSQDRAA